MSDGFQRPIVIPAALVTPPMLDGDVFEEEVEFETNIARLEAIRQTADPNAAAAFARDAAESAKLTARSSRVAEIAGKCQAEAAAMAARANVPVYPMKWHGDHDETPLKKWLVDKTLPQVGKAIASGQWGVYKTFVVLDLARAVMTKTAFAGRAVHRQGGVLFIAAEGQDEVRVRLEGIARDKVAAIADPGNAAPVDAKRMPFAWVETCPRLTADDAAEKLGAIVSAAAAAMRDRFSLPLALVVIDTLMPAAGFKDANDASETQRVMTVLTTVALQFECLVLCVDHFGKDASTGTRNSSVKEDAVDAVLAIIADRNIAGVVSNPRLAIRKVRGAPTGGEIPFSTRVVTVYENVGYDAVTTLVVDWESSKSGDNRPVIGRHNHEQAIAPKPLPHSLRTFKAAFDFVFADAAQTIQPFIDGPGVRAVKRELVRLEFKRRHLADNSKAKDKAFGRAEREAIERRLFCARDITVGDETETFFWTVEKETPATSGPVEETETGDI